MTYLITVFRHQFVNCYLFTKPKSRKTCHGRVIVRVGVKLGSAIKLNVVSSISVRLNDPNVR